MSWKGQSSIEYLTTYGWMVVAVGVAGAALYPNVNIGCDTQIENDFRSGGIALEQAGVDQQGSFKVVLDSDTRQEILIESASIEGNNQMIEVVQPRILDPGADLIYPIGNVEKTGSCQEYKMNFSFEKGPLAGQTKTINVKGSLNLIESFLSLIRSEGDRVQTIEIETSVTPTNDTLCIGERCKRTIGEIPGEEDQYVNESGDEMEGTLFANNVENTCYGEECEINKTEGQGFVNTSDAVVKGTLNMTELKPLQTLCLGKNEECA